jgi:MYXO-CTERM domain-containing protein
VLELAAAGGVDGQRLLAQFSSPVGAPHLGRVLQPEPEAGARQDPRPPEPATVDASGRGRSGGRNGTAGPTTAAGTCPPPEAAGSVPAAALLLGVGGLTALRRRTQGGTS